MSLHAMVLKFPDIHMFAGMEMASLGWFSVFFGGQCHPSPNDQNIQLLYQVSGQYPKEILV
jgi:hypothetical protein